MRTTDDLREVFGLLDQQLTAHLDRSGQHAGQHAEQALPFDLVDDVPPAARRRTLVALAGAMTVAAAVVAVVLAVVPRSADTVAGGAGRGRDLPVARLVFSVDPHAGLRMIEARTGGTPRDQEIELWAATGLYRLHVAGVLVPPFVPPNARSVVVDGGAPARYGCPHAHQDGVCQLVWQYAPDSWAAIFPDGQADGSLPLLRTIVAALDFTRSTALTTPIGLTHLPAGLHLDSLDSIRAADDGNGPQEKPVDSRWALGANLAGRHGADLVLNYGPGPLRAVVTHSGRAVTVRGHRGVWNAREHTLYLAFGATTVEIDVPAGWSYRRAAAVAADVRVVAHPGRTATWWTASRAFG